MSDTIQGHWKDAPDAVTLIDAHRHLWDLQQNRHPWLCGDEQKEFFMGDYSPLNLKHNYLPQDYLGDASGHNVLTTVHCEAEWDRANQVGETRWLTEIHDKHGFPGAIVAHAWFDTETAEEIIAAQAAFPRGIRSKPVTAASPHRMAPGAPGTMQDEPWLRGFALLEKYGLSWDLRVPFWHLREAAEVAHAFPRTPIVLNHTGFPWDRSEEGLAAGRRAMAAIAREPNVHVKVSEFGLKNSAWDYQSNRRVVRDAVAIFGIERSMFATNFPVAGLRIDYRGLVRSIAQMLQDWSSEDQARFFWRNAAAFYRL
jgi:predicted TIM-barrel fold metal-dependent hydrolase